MHRSIAGGMEIIGYQTVLKELAQFMDQRQEALYGTAARVIEVSFLRDN